MMIVDIDRTGPPPRPSRRTLLSLPPLVATAAVVAVTARPAQAAAPAAECLADLLEA